MWNQNLNEVSMISIFVHANVLTPVGSKPVGPSQLHWPDCLELPEMTSSNHICGPKVPAKIVFWNFWQQTFSYARLISRGVSNEDNTTFIIVVIFFRGCVPEVVVTSCAVGFLYIPKKLGFVYFIAVQPKDVHIYSSTLWPDGRICVFAHQTTSLSLCRPICV